ncbi:MAG TPA: NUDIX domain-containing protein [Saprospiraceae bacterium]|nr:NUDIX domain-containing protein [Saprospiraceae bacterium]
MAKQSAGILLYRFHNKKLEVLLVHPGGPFWAKKDAGAWSIPKGEFEENESPFNAALREVEEELGFTPKGNFIPLTPIKQKSGKLVHAWAVESNFDETKLRSNTFEMEWPPRSGKKMEFPEIDKAEWFDVGKAREKILVGQVALINELEVSIVRL